MAFASGKYSIGICGRCKMKVPYQDLRQDGNIQGLYVCQDEGCFDQIDPYKKPPRQMEPIALHHPRPDANIATHPIFVCADSDFNNTAQFEIVDENGTPIIT